MDLITEKIEAIRDAIDEKDDFTWMDDDALSHLNEIKYLMENPAEFVKILYADIPDSEMNFASHGDLKVFFDKDGYFVYDVEENRHYISSQYLKIKL